MSSTLSPRGPTVLVPVLPLRDVCLFPEASLATIAATIPALKAVEIGQRTGGQVLAIAQKEPDLAAWRDGMSALAQHPRLTCKLSGLVTEAGPDWGLETLKPVADHLLASFGPERLIFGSDWPVVTLRASYAQWFEAAEQLLAGLTQVQRAAVFGGNAEKLYLTRRGRR